MSPSDVTLDNRAARLRSALGSRIVLAGDPDYDAVRVAWNLAIDQRPFAVASPESAEDVVAVVRAATTAGLRIAPQSTGHGAAGLADTDLSDVVLVNLAGLRGVTVHPDTRSARVLGGSTWNDVVAATAPHGLTALHGSAGDVSVVGYTLSGGISFYARQHGLAVNSVRAVQLVTADGSLVRASAGENAELFWAVRGGSGGFGVVVSIEIDLLPYADVVAGVLLWDASRALEVGEAWAEWTASAPESVTSTFRVMHFPPLPELPPFLAGRSVAVIDGAVLETDADAAALLAPLRALAPEVDTFGRIPSAALVAVHMDPPTPTPAVTAHAVLRTLTPDAVEAFVDVASTPGLFIAELRHLGGALTRRPPRAGAIATLDGEYLVHTIAVAPTTEALSLATATTQAAVSALSPWRSPRLALTFIDGGGVDRSAGFGDAAALLRELKAAHDPQNVFAASHPLA